jgi:hypothetical protein
LFTAWASEQENNLIEDPTFETVGVLGTGALWQAIPAELEAQQVTGERGPGIRLTSASGEPFLKQNLSLPAEGFYEMRIEAKGASGTKYRIYVEWVDDNGFHGGHSGWQGGSDEWDERVFDFQYTGSASACYVVLQMTGEGFVEFAKPVLVPVAN